MTPSSARSKPFSAEILLVALFLTLSIAAGSSGAAESGLPAPPPALWIDFEKNAARLTSPAAIEAVVDSAARSGFRRLIIDLKRSDGAVVFKSRRAPQVPLDFDYFETFRKAADGRGLETIAHFEVFIEGDTRKKVGPAYDNPAWQTVIGNEQTGLVKQSEFTAKGPVLFANPTSADVQKYESSVIQDLLTTLKPKFLMLDEVRFFVRESDMGDSTHIQFETWAGVGHTSISPAAASSDPAQCWPASVLNEHSPRLSLWATYRVGVIREFLARIESLRKSVAPETELYLAAPGYYEPSVQVGLNWAHPDYKPQLWYAGERFQKMGAAANLFQGILVLNRDVNPRAIREVIRGAETVTMKTLPVSVLVNAGQHVRSPGRFRECLQTIRDSGMGVVIGDLSQMGTADFWTIVAEEFPAP